MLEAGIKTLDEVKTLDVHVDPLTNMNKSTNPAAAVDVDNAAAAAKEMISKLLEGGTAFKDKTRVAAAFAPAAERVFYPLPLPPPVPIRAIMPAARYRQMPMPVVAPPPLVAIPQVAPPPVIRLVPPAKRRRTIVAPVRLI